jgi:hypothetical protein
MISLTIIILLCAGAAAFLIMALVHFNLMSHRHFESSRRKARELLQKNNIIKAEQRLVSALKNIGWDYAGVHGKKRVMNVEGGQTFWQKLAVSMKFIPPTTIEWAVPGLLLLGEIYEKKELYEKAYQLYEDLSGYMSSAGDSMPRIDRTRAEAELNARQSRIDLSEGNNLSALKHHAVYILENIYLTKLENKETEFNTRYPYQGDARLDEILEKMGRMVDRDAVLEIINRSVSVEMGRVHVDRALRDLNNLLMGRKSKDDKEREATRVMIKSVLEKAAEKDKEEDDNGPEDNGSDVILL